MNSKIEDKIRMSESVEPFELTLNQVNFEEKDLSPTQELYSFRYLIRPLAEGSFIF